MNNVNNINYAIKAEQPDSILVADRPLRLGGKVESLAVGEFQKRFGCAYSDSITITPDVAVGPIYESIVGEIPSSELKRQVQKVLRSTSSNLVICNMGALGHGVFALNDIPKDTVVAIYGGTIMRGDKVSSQRDYAISYHQTNLSFSTLKHRGIASFMQHLPEALKVPDPKRFSQILKMVGQEVSEDDLKLNIELYSTEFSSDEARRSVAVENIRKEFLKFNNFPVIALVTQTDIKAGDQLGFNYGHGYWLSRNITPEFFDKKGQILSLDLYRKTFGRLQFESFTRTGEFHYLLNFLKLGATSVTIAGDDKKPHEVSVAELFSLLLQAKACRAAITT